jgi:basic amino acid/polyamine antiporter, APA family
VAGELRRDLRLLDAVGVGLGAIVGAGLFVVTGVAAGVAGPAFLVGLALAGVAATCNALSSAQLAAAFPQSGGTYEYGYRVLNPWLGFAAGWMFLASKLAAGGTVALGFGGYLARLVPGVDPRAAAVTAAVLLAGANYFGIKKAGRLNTVVVAVTLLGLVYFIGAGFTRFDPGQFQPFAPHGWDAVLRSAALLFFAYTGYARLATLGEEVHDPERTIPRAIVLSLASALLLYAGVATVALGAVGAARLASDAPLEGAARAIGSPGLVTTVGVSAVTAMLGVLLSQILGISRMLFAMARRRDLPALLGAVSPGRGVPDRAVLLTGGVIILVALFGTLQWVVAAASFTILLYYSITNLAALRLPREQQRFPAWVARLGLVCCLAMAASLSAPTILYGVGLLAVGLAGRRVLRRD